MKTPRTLLVIAITLVTLVLSACAGAQLTTPQNLDGQPIGDTAQRNLDPYAPPIPDEGGGAVTGGQGFDAGQANRLIIKTGEITVEVEDVATTTGTVRALALELDGYVSSSFQGHREESATLTLRIPADRFEDALAALHELDVEVLAEATREEDITAVVVDTEARLTNLRAAEEQYRALLDRAERVEDILAIQNQLFQVRGEIEAMEAQLKYLNDQAAMATLTVTIVPVPAPVEQATEDFDPGAIVQEAVAQLVGFGQWLVAAGIWFVIVGLPALIVLGIALFIGLRVVRRFAPARIGRARAAEDAGSTD